jgi:mono/diheme cytochrome c family protein
LNFRCEKLSCSNKVIVEYDFINFGTYQQNCMRNPTVYVSLVAALFIWGACKHEIPPATTGDICFETEILPIFNSKCASSNCHGGNSPAEGILLNSYEHILASESGSGIIPYNASESELIEVILEDDVNKRMPPVGSQQLTSEEINKISAWINEGAPNTINCASASCDSTLFLFNTHVQPILQSNCVGCHGGSEPSAGYNFSSYAGVKQAVDDARLLGAIEHWSDFSPMPAQKLDACNRAKIRKWIQAGALDN